MTTNNSGILDIFSTDKKEKTMNNSEILFIYDAKMTNPNGDFDNENKPRMDYDTERNLVSDVRLKRYLRDYFETNLGKEIFITEKAESAEERLKALGVVKEEKKDNKKIVTFDKERLRDKLIDVRMFGAVLATQGGNYHLTGPIQFNWGYSLNKVQLCESSSITSSFSSGEGIGHDYRVKYSLIAFNGSINGSAANETKLSDGDIKIFDEAMLKAIPANRTRSKINQFPRLYMRIEMKDNQTFMKDLREYVKFIPLIDEYKIENVENYELNISELVEYINKFNDKIEKIVCWKDDKIKITGWEELPKTTELNILQ